MFLTNMSAEEVIKYGLEGVDQTAITILERLVDEKAKQEEEIESCLRREESLEEQVTFASSLIEEIQELMKQKGTKKNLVNEITLAIEYSAFEK